MGNVLETTASAIRVHEQQLAVTQKNIINANDPNYIKNNVNVVSDPQLGARIESITISVNENLQRGQYNANSEYHKDTTKKESLEQIMDLFGLPKKIGDDTKDPNSINPKMTAVLEDFFNSFNNLQLASVGMPDMQRAFSTSEDLAKTISTLATDLQNLRSNIDETIAEKVDYLNSEISKLRELNTKIPLLRGEDTALNGAKMQIIISIREISKIIDIKHYYDQDGLLVLETGNGEKLVNGNFDYQLMFKHTTNFNSYLDPNFNFEPLSIIDRSLKDDVKKQYESYIVSGGYRDNIVHNLSGGELYSLFDLRDKFIPNTLDIIDNFSNHVVTEINKKYSNSVLYPGFDTMMGNTQFKLSDKINIDTTKKLKVAFLDNSGKAYEVSGTAVPLFEIDLISLTSGTQTVQDFIAFINTKGIGKIQAEMVDKSGAQILLPVNTGFLKITPTGVAPRFAIIADDTNFANTAEELATSTANNNLTSFNAYFGFNQLFDHNTNSYYTAGKNLNSAISMQLSDKVKTNEKISPGKITVTSDTDYILDRSNKSIIPEILSIKSKNLEFSSSSYMPTANSNLEAYSGNILLGLGRELTTVENKEGVSKLNSNAIDQKISSQSGVNTDEELLNIQLYEKIYLSTLKVFQTFQDYYKQFLAAI
ncbi:MAG: flagellar hook-associated protein FlgK [Candidatus Midichloriaceae bacterium]|jgi:flagellar hook-associated protein FlgK